jgi:transposase
MRSPTRLALSSAERRALRALRRGRRPTDRLARRASIVLAAAQGKSIEAIARQVGVSAETVVRWRARYRASGVAGIAREAPRAGARSRLAQDLVERILRSTVERNPGVTGPAWSTRSLARSLGTNHMAVYRTWHAFGLAPTPRRAASAKGRRLPRIDLVGTYVGQDAATLVFAVDPPNRTEPDRGRGSAEVAPAPGSAPRGDLTSDLAEWAARTQLRVPPAHRSSPGSSRELLVLLRTIEERTPRTTRLDLVLDRPVEEMGPRWIDWLERHPRYRAFPTRPGQDWGRAAEAWFERWRRASLDPRSFRNVAFLRSPPYDGSGQRGSGTVYPLDRGAHPVRRCGPTR